MAVVAAKSSKLFRAGVAHDLAAERPASPASRQIERHIASPLFHNRPRVFTSVPWTQGRNRVLLQSV
jgi:hypothetical protein